MALEKTLILSIDDHPGGLDELKAMLNKSFARWEILSSAPLSPEVRLEPDHLAQMVAEKMAHERVQRDALINSTDDLIWSVDPDLNLLMAYLAFLDSTREFSGKELKLGESVLQPTFPPEMCTFWAELYHEALGGKNVQREYHTWATAGFPDTWLELKLNPIRSGSKIVGVACFGKNVTERKRAETALRENEERLRFTMENSNIGSWELDLSTGMASRSLEHARIFGYSDLGTPWDFAKFLQHVVPEDRENVNDFLHQVRTEGADCSFECRILRADGEIRWIFVRGHQSRPVTGRPPRLTGIVQDITARKQSEQDLQESEYFFKESQRASYTGSYKLDFPTGVWGYSEVLGQIFGIDPTYPTTIEGWLNLVAPPDQERMSQYFQNLVERGESKFNQEYRILRASDREVRWVHGLGEIRYDEEGKPLVMIGTIRDITERKLVAKELEGHRYNLEELVKHRTTELELANQELESFSYSVSHDLRAPLRRIDGFVNLLLCDCRELLPEDGLRNLQIISSSARRMGILIDDLLHFSRTSRQEMNKELLDMNLPFQDALHMVHEENADRQIEWKITPLPQVVGDHHLLRQVWVNLLENAVKYTSKCDFARIEIQCLDREEETRFSIQDNGVGFDMQYADKLFGVFQRLHRQDEFEGTGIGLVTVHRIIARHKGRVWAESTPGHGATFFFTLPKPSLADHD